MADQRQSAPITNDDPRPEPMTMQEPTNYPLATTGASKSAIMPGSTEITVPVLAQPVVLPRNEAAILAKIKIRAAMAGDDWYYRYPVKDHGATKYIEGPSVKCTDNVFMIFGNCTLKTRAVDLFDSWMINVQFVDYESGVVLERPYQQAKGQQTIKTKDQGRQEAIAFQIGVSKAQRNVINHALSFFVEFAWEEARNSLIERIGKDLPGSRAKLKAALAAINVDLKTVEAHVGRAVDSWLAPDCARVNAEVAAIKDGMATADETWPIIEKPTRESVKAKAEQQQQTEKSADTSPRVQGPTPPSPANQGSVPQPGEGRHDEGGNGTGAAKFEMYDEQGEIEGTAESERDWAISFIEACRKSPSRRNGLQESNSHLFEIILPVLDAGDDAHKVVAKDLRTLLAYEAPVEQPKPIVLPKLGSGAIDVAAYIKTINLEIGAAPDETMVRKIVAREKPNMDLLKPGPRGAITIRAQQRVAELGTKLV